MNEPEALTCPEHRVPLVSGPPALPPPEGQNAHVITVWRCPKSMCRHAIVEAACPVCRAALQYLEQPEFVRVVGGVGHGSWVHANAKLHCPEHGDFEWQFGQAVVQRPDAEL